jgi:uncharacterized protein (DUF58 family)
MQPQTNQFQNLQSDSYLAPETLAQLNPFELRSKMIVEGIRSGLHISPHKGMSVEFNQHRPYTPGDDLKHLDWKVLARSDRPTIKQYDQETTLDVEILVDCSASMRFGTLGVKKGWGGTGGSKSTSMWTKFDHCTAVAAALAWLALQNSDRVGVALFANGVTTSIPKSSNRTQWKQIISLLSREPLHDTTNLKKSCDQALTTSNNRCLFIILSDFLTELSSIQQTLANLSNKNHDVICIQTLDAQETSLNINTATTFKGLESNASLCVNPSSVREAYLQILNKHLESIFECANKHKFEHLVLNTHKSIGPPLAAIVAKRMKWLKSHHVS